MAKRKQHKYTGVLGKPLRFNLEPANTLNALAVGRALSRARKDLEKQYVERFRALFSECCADLSKNPNWRELVEKGEDWRLVAMTLAERHVPGFSYVPP